MDAETRELFGKLLDEIKSVKTDLNNNIDSLDGKVIRNSILIESIQTDIKTIIEVQKAHMEKNERNHLKILEHIDCKTDFIENVLQKHGQEISALKMKIG